MTEHEKLKAICDKIEYKINRELIETDGATYSFEIDVREIIFTPEFMEKYTAHYCFIKNYCQVNKYYQSDMIDILNNLNNPVDYLYNLLELGIEKN